MKTLSVLGSTGSIGLSTLDIVRRHPDSFKVLGLAAGSNVDVLKSQIEEFAPQLVSVKSEKEAIQLKEMIGDHDVEILYGTSGAIHVAGMDGVDMVVSAIVGAAGLLPTLEALKKGRCVGLANKESMVIAGELMNRVKVDHKATLLPIDSEHSALFQCLEGHDKQGINKLILTASGGPFFQKPAEDFRTITVEQALKHPNWDMGAKITIDSATMMNKGLEVMEARWLFDLTVDQIDICIHPQSIVHSMVEYRDGSVLAQMGWPDMRTPIAYALSYPERIESGVESLNLAKLGNLTFFEPDFQKFPNLKLAYDVGREGKTYPSVLNAANEIAVDAFLKKRIGFTDIHHCVKNALDVHQPQNIKDLEDVLEADEWARNITDDFIGRLSA